MGGVMSDLMAAAIEAKINRLFESRKCTLYSMMIGMVFVFQVMRFFVQIDTN